VLRARVLVRGDADSGVQPLLWYVDDRGLAYSVGVSARQPIQDALWVSPEIVEASFKLRPAGWQRFSRTRPEPATPPSCAVV